MKVYHGGYVAIEKALKTLEFIDYKKLNNYDRQRR